MSRVPVGYRFYWDSDCRLCNSLKRIGQALDWRSMVTFVPLDSDAANIDLGHMSWEERMSSSHLVSPEGRVLSRGEGALALAALLPLTAPLVFIFRLLPYHAKIADRAYGWVSAHRGVPYGGTCKVSFGQDQPGAGESCAVTFGQSRDIVPED
jgi:predicted DCC family thiol-disulfide oxidoreductase YuxK